MKKYLSFGVLAIAFGAMFSGCSKTSDFSDAIEQNKAQLAENQKNEYRLNFEKKYGKVDANQSWDFTKSTSTRADLGVVLDDLQDPSHFQQNVTKEKGDLKDAIPGAPVLKWNPIISVCMYPVYCWNESLKNQNLHMNVISGNESQTIFSVQMKNDAWWGNKGATGPSNRGKAISTLALYDLGNTVTWTLSNSNGGTKNI